MTAGGCASGSDSDETPCEGASGLDAESTPESESPPGPESSDVQTFATRPVRNTADTRHTVFGISNERSFAFSVDKATSLPDWLVDGYASEFAVLDVAAKYGHPDAVFDSRHVATGSGTKERGGDGIILCGKRGLIVSSKKRQAETAAEVAVEQGRIQRRINKAYGQACGSHRPLMGASPSVFTNWRGRSIPIDGRTVDWTTVVVVDLPEGQPSFLPTIPVRAGKPPAIVLARTDWDFLYRQLRSNYAVVDYLHRVRGDQRPLGAENWRYAEYVLNDMGPGLPHLAESESSTSTAQVHVHRPLPGDPVEDADLVEHLVLRLIMEQVGLIESGLTVSEVERLNLLNFLDSFPVIHRTELGRSLRAEFAAALERREGRADISYSISVDVVDESVVSLFFGVAAEYSDAVAHDHESAKDVLFAQLRAMGSGTGCAVVAIMLYIEANDPILEWGMRAKMRRG